MFPYGAYSMLYELHFALDKYYSAEVKQSVYHIKPTENGRVPAFFQLQSQQITPADLGSKIKSEATRPVVLFHKLWGSNCDPIAQAVKGKSPFLILNHTQGSSKKGVSRSDGVIAVSKHMLTWMHSTYRGHRHYFIRNGVNQCRYESPSAVKIDQLDGYFVTGRMNNFNDCKHPHDWIQFCSGIRLPDPLWHDYLGAGRHLASAKQHVERYKKTAKGNVVNLTGRVDNFDRKLAHIQRWDAFLYEIPGIEGTSMSLLEALACGVPAIINNKPGNNEIIKNDVNGLVYRNRREAIALMNTLCKSPKALAKLRASTKKHFAEHLDAKHTARAYLDLFREVT